MKKNIIKDNILGTIIFDGEYADLYQILETQEFKRLYNVNQIAFLERYISSASVSRFAHSLGVFEILRRVFKNENFQKIPLQTRRETMAAALLHDIGHGPFSHTFEHIFTDFNHENQTIKIILGESQINETLKNLNLNPENIANIIRKKTTKEVFQFQIDLISSQLDVDRVDYFFRDSGACGFAYGRFDLGLFIEYIDLKDNKIVFDSHLTSLIIDFLTARFKSYLFTYRNKEGQTLTYVLSETFKELFSDDILLNDNIFKNIKTQHIFKVLKKLFFQEPISNKEFIFLDDTTFNAFLKNVWIESESSIITKKLNFLLSNIFEKNILKWRTTDNIDDLEIISSDSNVKKIVYSKEKQPILIFNHNHPHKIQELSTLPIASLLEVKIPNENYVIGISKENFKQNPFLKKQR